MPGPIDGEKHLIQVPLIARTGTPAPEFIRIRLPELAAPLADGLVGHENPTGEQQLFHIAVAQTEAEVEPDAMADDLSWKAVILVALVGGVFMRRVSHTERELDKSLNKLTMPRQPEPRDPWLARAASSVLEAFQRVANRLREDADSVKAGVTRPWSHGPVEGYINRLKMLKRQMCGRAKRDSTESALALGRGTRARPGPGPADTAGGAPLDAAA